MTNSSILPMPASRTFLLETPLNREFQVIEENVFDLLNFKGTIDLFCPDCEKSSIFEFSGSPFPTPAQMSAPLAGQFTHQVQQIRLPSFFEVTFRCVRDNNHRAIFHFRISDGLIRKIGEFPSCAERNTNDIKKYNTILGKEKRSLLLAIEAYSQNIGAGAIIYLRRIFENVVVERVATRKYSGIQDWNFQAWKKSKPRMKDKLKDLSDSLPDFLNHQELYRILSVGIHSLEEENCLQHFPTIKQAIIEILEIEMDETKAKTREIIGENVSRINHSL